MVKGIDFLQLYREFHLEPGADIDDLKRAYRRRVSMVHPDRLDARDAISQHLATEHLQRLTTLYEAGVQFHRQHGRLPGASSSAGNWSEEKPDEAASQPAPRGKQRMRGLRWAAGTLVLAGIGAWWMWPAQPATEAVVGPPAAAVHRAILGARTTTALPGEDGIRVGMGKDEVIRINGAPVMREGERWLYGPSWILFREGKVAEWYNSPLHPLRISSTAGK